MDKIRIRPSSVASFVSCPRQWFYVFIEGVTTIPNVRAAVGTGIHAGVETMWTDIIKTKDIGNVNISSIHDSAISSFDNEVRLSSGRMSFDDELADSNLAHNTIKAGVDAFVEDILPFTAIPTAVEKRYTVEIRGHPVVEDISGTIDYIDTSSSEAIIGDVKTSKRKIVPSGHTIQQSIYKQLVEANGTPVGMNIIQGVVLGKRKTEASSAVLIPNVPQARYLVNNLLDRLRAYHEGGDPNLLFPGNPKHYLCSEKYCSLHSTCPFVNGEL